MISCSHHGKTIVIVALYCLCCQAESHNPALLAEFKASSVDFAFYNCTGTNIFDAESELPLCYCLNIYDLKGLNMSAMDQDLLQPETFTRDYAQTIKAVSAEVDFVSCKFSFDCDCPWTPPNIQLANSTYGIADVQWAYQDCVGIPITDRRPNSTTIILDVIICNCAHAYNHTLFVSTGKKDIREKSVSFEDCHRSAICDCGGRTPVPESTTRPNGRATSCAVCGNLLFLILPLSFTLLF